MLDDATQDIENISIELSVHSPESPLSTECRLSVKFTLNNAKYLEISNWQEDIQPTFTLIINDPISIGLEDFQDNYVEQFMEDIILACNILLNRVVFSKYASNSNKPKPVFKKQESASEVCDTPTGKVVMMDEHLRSNDRISIIVGIKDELDEIRVLEIFSKIRKMRSGTAKSVLDIHNFQKSLKEYDAYTKATEKITIFKHLYSSIELAVNCDDAPDRCGTKLDDEISNITKISKDDIKHCREFNNRMKHKDRNADEEKIYQDGLAKLKEQIRLLHIPTQKMIQARFDAIF